MTEHISDEYFVTREVVTYNGSALVSGEKDLVVEECYQLVVNGRGAGEITCSPWDKKEAFLGYLYLRGYISGAGDVRTIDVDEEHGMANITIREYLTNVTDMENLLPEDEVLLNEQGVIPKRDDVRLSVSEVLTYSRELEERSVLFHRTGGVHRHRLRHDLAAGGQPPVPYPVGRADAGSHLYGDRLHHQPHQQGGQGRLCGGLRFADGAHPAVRVAARGSLLRHCDHEYPRPSDRTGDAAPALRGETEGAP